MIKSSDELLSKGILSDSLTIDVYIMRAVALYSMGDDASTRKSFENILKIRRNYTPDPAQISPKLISIFGEVKADFLKNNPLPISDSDTTQQSIPVKLFSQERIRGLVLENLVMPGIAQFQLGKNPKGILLSAASTINLGAMIYYLVNTKNKENDYLNETDKLLIQEKYSIYNDSYKIRNTLIISYALIWIYSQIDLIFFSDDEPSSTNSQQAGYIQYRPDLFSDYKVSFQLPF
jgi:hypothetical protein